MVNEYFDEIVAVVGTYFALNQLPARQRKAM
jgi:hypothetical protein